MRARARAAANRETNGAAVVARVTRMAWEGGASQGQERKALIIYGLICRFDSSVWLHVLHAERPESYFWFHNFFFSPPFQICNMLALL